MDERGRKFELKKYFLTERTEITEILKLFFVRSTFSVRDEFSYLRSHSLTMASDALSDSSR